MRWRLSIPKHMVGCSFKPRQYVAAVYAYGGCKWTSFNLDGGFDAIACLETDGMVTGQKSEIIPHFESF